MSTQPHKITGADIRRFKATRSFRIDAAIDAALDTSPKCELDLPPRLPGQTNGDRIKAFVASRPPSILSRENVDRMLEEIRRKGNTRKVRLHIQRAIDAALSMVPWRSEKSSEDQTPLSTESSQAQKEGGERATHEG